MNKIDYSLPFEIVCINSINGRIIFERASFFWEDIIVIQECDRNELLGIEQGSKYYKDRAIIRHKFDSNGYIVDNYTYEELRDLWRDYCNKVKMGIITGGRFN